MKAMKMTLSMIAGLAMLSLTAAPASGVRPAPAKGGRPAAAATGRRAAHGGERRRAVAERDRMSHEDRRLIERLEEAEHFGEVMRLYPQARASRNPYVRAALVDALDEHGERAVNLLAALIADPDEDVADAAFTAWSGIVDDLPWRRRAAVVVEAAAAIRQPAVAVPPPVPVAPAQPVAVPAGQPVPVAPAPVVVAP